MDFFTHQDNARKQTRRMVFLFLVAVVTIVAALNLFFSLLYFYGIDENFELTSFFGRLDQIPSELTFWVTIIALLVIGAGSLNRIIQLKTGGEAVAEMMGARKVSRDTQSPQEKKLLNVVDEMAIAAGVTVPQVYIMDDEEGINAFAAGYKPNQAVVAVTQGTLDELERDELQGVVAHEFSHILNGDMRLNIRLLGVLSGILVIGSIGAHMLYSVVGRRRYRRRRRGATDPRTLVFFVSTGLALLIIGYSGVFFGRLIQASVSRQREYLADASAVQFTRDDLGISNALRKIGRQSDGSLVANVHSEELRHMFFGESCRVKFASLMASHPPLMERVKRINRGRVPQEPLKQRETPQPHQPADDTPAKNDAGIVGTIGNPNMMHMQYAAALLASIPAPVSQALAMKQGATALMLALVLDQAAEVRAVELDVISQSSHAPLKPEVLRLAAVLDQLHARYRLPLFDMAIPVLKDLPVTEKQVLVTLVKRVIDADRTIKLDELTIYVLLKAHLSATANRADRVKYKTFKALRDEIQLLLSLLSHLGKRDQQNPADVFKAAYDELQAPALELALQNPRTFKPAKIISALETFAEISPDMKRRLVAACVTAVLFDQDVSVRELELMRSICDVMDAPMPPVLTEQKETAADAQAPDNKAQRADS